MDRTFEALIVHSHNGEIELAVAGSVPYLVADPVQNPVPEP